jgi:hypothetical protein
MVTLFSILRMAFIVTLVIWLLWLPHSAGGIRVTHMSHVCASTMLKLFMTGNLETISPETASNSIAEFHLSVLNLEHVDGQTRHDLTHNVQKLCNKAIQTLLNFKNICITMEFGFS